ncbi:MAG: nitrogenase component 1 [Methanoregula sp.]|jgi:nitrogenase molybdenum-iron protein alpha/beta subunit|nr:nitrogenase component 1 [Methanoregula sp.]
MILNTSPTLSSRSGGCTLTGALSVTTHVRDAVSIIHGPKGCAHHNFSLLHATGLDNDLAVIPDLVSSALAESDIVFGGEEALARTILAVCERDVSAVFVLSTCIVDTIGDDVVAVCSREYPVPVIPISTAGFLGGNFQDGVNKALISLAALAEPTQNNGCVNFIGEMNLEYEVEENYAEIARILTLLGLTPGIRFVHNITLDEISELGAAQLNILRDPQLVPVGEYLKDRFGTPFLPSFPTGLSDTLSFIESIAGSCGIDGKRAVGIEQALQAEILADFTDLADSHAVFCGPVSDPMSSRAAQEAADALHIRVGNDQNANALPVHPVVGTAGVKRMLHRWRRSLHA